MNYIVFWKDAPGQQVYTVVDAEDRLVERDDDYIETNSIKRLDSEEDVLMALANASGDKYAITRELARNTLGWDV